MEADLPGLAITLIIFQVVDALACAIPLAFITRKLDAVDCPARVRGLLPWIKVTSAVGLTIGLWEPAVGAVSGAALVAYFLAAIGFHVRARDTVAHTAPAVVLLAVTTTVTLVSYVPAI